MQKKKKKKSKWTLFFPSLDTLIQWTGVEGIRQAHVETGVCDTLSHSRHTRQFHRAQSGPITLTSR